MPDDCLDGQLDYVAAKEEACKAETKKLAQWNKTLKSSEKALAEVKADLDKRIESFESLREQRATYFVSGWIVNIAVGVSINL